MRVHQCRECGGEFEADRPGIAFCSDECRIKRQRAQWRAASRRKYEKTPAERRKPKPPKHTTADLLRDARERARTDRVDSATKNGR